MGIKIKEITKPEEIRITDDKPKAFKPTKSTTTTTTTVAPSTISPATTEASIDGTSTQHEQTSTKQIFIEDSNPQIESEDYMDDGTILSENAADIASPSTDTFEVVEPELTFEVVEPELTLVNADANTIGDATSSKNVRQTIESSTNRLDVEQSPENVSELFSSTTDSGIEINGEVSTSNADFGEVVSSTPNIVVVKQGGKNKSFQISGIEGLQRVDVTENSQSDSNESPMHNEGTDKSGSTTEEIGNDFSSTTVSLEKFDDDTEVASVRDLNEAFHSNEDKQDGSTRSSNEPSTSSSDQSSESSSEFSSSSTTGATTEDSSTVSIAADPLMASTVDPIDMSSTTLESVSLNSPSDVGVSTSTEQSSSTTPQTQESTPQTRSSSIEPCAESSSRSTHEDDETTNAENPEYPYIPDDFSIHCKQIEEEERRHQHSEESSSSTTEAIEQSSATAESAEKHSTTQGPLQDNDKVKESLKLDAVKSRAPGEPHLVPEWERITTAKPLIEHNTGLELIVSTTSGPLEQIKADNETTTKSDTSSEESYGNREPTTERSTTQGYRDSIESDNKSSISSTEIDTSTLEQVSPKDDAESIKLIADGPNESIKSAFRFIPDLFGDYIRVVYEMNNKENAS